MTQDITLEGRVAVLFERFNRQSARTSLSSRAALSKELNKLVDTIGVRGEGHVQVTPQLSSLFATAAVEIWQRGVHSFLISASLTEASRIWASVAGYYASHYSVRAFAHLLGVFQLYTRKKVASVSISNGQHWCHIGKKQGADREHKFYWKVVKANSYFASDPFLTNNSDDDEQRSDSGHRNIANYHDHIDQFPNFEVVHSDLLKRRIEYLSSIELSSVPIPRKDRFPDLEAVQLVAYHRIVKFRRFLDNALSTRNRLWQVHRTPSWCHGFLDFQVVEPRFIGVYQDAS